MAGQPSEKWRAATLACGVAAAFTAPNPALTQTRAFPVVSAVEQAQRDTDRLRILRSELSSEEAFLESAARRRAERLLARDEHGVREAEHSYARHLANIAALRREIDLTAGIRRVGGHNGAASDRQRTTSTNVMSAPPAEEKLREAHAPWWDVYQRRPASRPAGGQNASEVERIVEKGEETRRGVAMPAPWSVYRENKE